MQPLKQLSEWLSTHADSQHYLFEFHDLRALFNELTDSAFKTLLSRAVKANLLNRICKGIYLYKKTLSDNGTLLFHTATLLRANAFNYISLETALSDQGVISQLPINWITIMSSGRSSTISCGHYGTIEFVHTNQKPADIMNQLSYDHSTGMWRANTAQAIRDMKATHRNCDLIDWDIANELI